MTHRSVEVPVVARVEGEGALHVRIDDGEITRLELEIYEPPRFFESFLRGRHFSEVSDIVPRICGICPVAYQMTAIHGLERLFEVEVPEGTYELRRLLYCAEWIESHMLHVHPAGRARLPRVRLGDRDGSEGLQAARSSAGSGSSGSGTT